MSDLYYGGVQGDFSDAIRLTYVNTNAPIEYAPVMSDDGTDVMFTKITFNVTGIVSAPLPPTIPGETVNDTVDRIANALNQKRRAFNYVTGGQTLVNWLGGPDCRNGPRPLSVHVQPVGDASFIVRFAIELNIVTCPEDPQVPWVSHRWTEEVTIDETARTTLTRRGKIVTRGDMLTSPDALRGLVAPVRGKDFQRVSSHYAIQSDGLALTYEYVDQEKYYLPPEPAFKAQGEYIESTPVAAQRWAEVRLTLHGAKGTDRGLLIKVAVLIVQAKLKKLPLLQTNPVLVFGAIQEDMYEPIITVSARAKLHPYVGGAIAGLPINFDHFKDPPLGSEPDKAAAPDIGTRGSAGLELIAQALGDPCLRTINKTIGARDPGQDVTLRTDPPITTVKFTTQVPDTLTKYKKPDTANDSGIYSSYLIRVHTDHDVGQLVVPVGSPQGDPIVANSSCAIQYKTVEWSCERLGSPPKIPDPDVGPNFVLLKVEFSDDQLEAAGDGVSLKYSRSGRYKYLVKNVKQAHLTSTVPPWLSDSQKDANRSYLGTFAKGVIDMMAGGVGPTIAKEGLIEGAILLRNVFAP